MPVTDRELEDLEKEIEKKNDEGRAKVEDKAPEPALPPEPSQEEPSQSETPPEPSAGDPGKTFNATEWVKKKGWKSAEDAAVSMRELETKFHEKNEEIKRLREQGQPYPGPQPGYQAPPVPYGYPQPYAQPQTGFAPPPNPWMPNPQGRLTREQVAASYGLTPEDFDRVFPLIRDAMDIQSRQMASDFQKWKEEATRTSEKQGDMADVIRDPAFHNPDVQHEMHEILSKDPAVWNERRPLSRALNMALGTLGRRTITGNPAGSPSYLPTTPPKAPGSSHPGGPALGKRGGLPSVQDFEKKTPEQMEKELRGLNAFKTYEDFA